MRRPRTGTPEALKELQCTAGVPNAMAEPLLAPWDASDYLWDTSLLVRRTRAGARSGRACTG